jgi:6,7-dimethyl-8-ribityllumazine synthase
VNPDIDESSENALPEWSRRVAEDENSRDEPGFATEISLEPDAEPDESEVWGRSEPQTDTAEDLGAAVEEDDAPELGPGEAESEAPKSDAPESDEPESGAPESGEPESGEAVPMSLELSQEHAVGELDIPDGYAILEGEADGSRRAVGVVVARFNGAVTSKLLAGALDALEAAGVRREAITVMVVPGAFELPLAATALAKTRRFACIVALGCVIRGDTPHFDYVAGEAASGLQLAALETGVPVSFGVLTLDRVDQADARIEKGAEAVRTALEMADVFSHLRAAAAR